ncbi:PEP-CTERM sorting domain-containing protein [Adhaeretor mobilis]|uniref:PEP-CTERM sorting domain-containing protein n=1 Tax=Adhaeretor mobilis TaxID=1930276 RepID=UPI001C54DD14|nr:PEP-CTERM sorting domain-containing protein [Adhaeretor mobilis]
MSTSQNPVEFRDGAIISPGNSPGVLSLGSSTTLGSDSVYQWEINDALGAAGESLGWDLLQVAGDLVFESTEQEPFHLNVISLDDNGDEGAIENFDPTQNYEWLIASAASISGFDPTATRIDTTKFSAESSLPYQERLSLRVEGGDLILVYQVPEPSSWFLIGIGLSGWIFRRKYNCE